MQSINTIQYNIIITLQCIPLCTPAPVSLLTHWRVDGINLLEQAFLGGRGHGGGVVTHSHPTSEIRV